MSTYSKRNMIHGMLISLGLAMSAIFVGSLFLYASWIIQDHQSYFLVFYINKGFQLFMLSLFVGLSVFPYERTLKAFNLKLNKLEKIPSYLVILLLSICIALAGISDSGDIFYLYGKYDT